MSAVQIELSGACAVLTIDNPPVNGITLEVREHLYKELLTAIEDPSVSAIVIAGRGDQFSAGADIRQFNTPASLQRPLTRDLHELISRSSKPVVAALHGYALGGALELALGCHFRIATPMTMLGLPEVKLGLIPGGGGTQRLPRLIGLAPALDMIQTGTFIGGSEAYELGLVDALTNGAVKDAVEFALSQLSTPVFLPLASRRCLNADGIDFVARRDAVPGSADNRRAQLAVIMSIEAGLLLDFESALTNERVIFDDLVSGAESAALREAFLGRRRAPL